MQQFLWCSVLEGIRNFAIRALRDLEFYQFSLDIYAFDSHSDETDLNVTLLQPPAFLYHLKKTWNSTIYET